MHLEHIQQLQDQVIPVVTEFKSTINEFGEEHADMKCCVAEFDKALCEKANRAALLMMKD